jgi:hypothetical protein
MRELAESLLLAASALVLHLYSLTSLASGIRILPAPRLESFWLQAGLLPRPGWHRNGNFVIAAGFAILSTFLMLSMLSSGLPMALLAALELALATIWLAYLAHGARQPRY